MPVGTSHYDFQGNILGTKTADWNVVSCDRISTLCICGPCRTVPTLKNQH